MPQRSTMSRAKAARELERQIMTMEVASGDELPDAEWPAPPPTPAALPAQPQDVAMPERLAFGPYGIAPLRGLHFDNAADTAAS
jgi:hypothetical protein